MQDVAAHHDVEVAVGEGQGLAVVSPEGGRDGARHAERNATRPGAHDSRRDAIRERHAAAYQDLAGDVRPLPGAVELLRTLTELGVPWAIASSISTPGITGR